MQADFWNYRKYGMNALFACRCAVIIGTCAKSASDTNDSAIKGHEELSNEPKGNLNRINQAIQVWKHH